MLLKLWWILEINRHYPLAVGSLLEYFCGFLQGFFGETPQQKHLARLQGLSNSKIHHK